MKTQAAKKPRVAPPPSPAPAGRGETVMAIDENRRLLNRYRFVEQEGMRLLAGWLPRVETFELKCELGRTIWEYSQHVNALYLRLREIQSPAFQTPDDAALVTLMRELLHAPNEFALAASIYRIVTPSLIRALETHESATFPNSDQPSVHVITHALLDLRAQQARAEALLRSMTPAKGGLAAARAWENYVRQLLAAAGGISGREPRATTAARVPKARTEFVAPKEAARDARFTQRHADAGTMPPEEDYQGHTVEEFERYSTEMLAAETVALVMFSVQGMPWEFQYDTARHLYDEVRHCLMGYEWMRAHDMNPFASPQYLHIFKWRSQFPPVMQYCLLTMGNEVHAFPYRHRRVKAHEESGDRLSEQFVRYDIADETQHVRFGRRWLPELLKHVGEKRPPEEYTAEVLKVWHEQYRTGKLTINVE
ncbi:MAG TPA: hypothetical protein VF388_02200 [Lacunisphaera sp.]